jgi:hypothetical protein
MATTSATETPISGEIPQPKGGEGGVASTPAPPDADGSPHHNFFPKIREFDLARQLGVARSVLLGWRKNDLRQGTDWDYQGKPKTVWFSESGEKAALRLLGVAEQDRQEDRPNEPQPAPAGHRYADDQIPRGPQNGLILEHGRPGWWTSDEAMVVANGFANRKAILVEFKGRQVICRVKDARNFTPRMVIPVREYGNIVLAARQPRFPGKW